MASIAGRAIIITKTNKSGGGLAKGAVVIVDTANDNAVTTTTTGGTTVTVGVVVEENGIANNASGRVQFGGHCALVTPNASVTRGHYALTHTVAGQCTDGGASRIIGAFGIFTTGGTTPEIDLFSQPDGSSASGNVATDAIWDAAGDLAVGTGANTAAKLTIGAAGGAVSRVNGAVAWNSGTSMPTAATGDRYWRTDLGMEFYYDGTRWLCTCAHEHSVGGYNSTDTQPLSQAGGAKVLLRSISRNDLFDMWITTARIVSRVAATNDATHFWTLSLAMGAQTYAADTKTDTAATVTSHVGTVNALYGSTIGNSLTATPSGGPGNIDIVQATFSFRYVGT